MGQFAEDIKKFSLKVETNSLKIFKEASKNTFARIIKDTPLFFRHEETTGNTRYNWRASLKPLSYRVLKGTDKSSTAKKTIDRMTKQVNKVKKDQSIYFANSAPAIFPLEYGGYPSEVQLGSYNTKTKQYEKRSKNKYSLQAPIGFVRVDLVLFYTWVKRLEMKYRI